MTSIHLIPFGGVWRQVAATLKITHRAWIKPARSYKSGEHTDTSRRGVNFTFSGQQSWKYCMLSLVLDPKYEHNVATISKARNSDEDTGQPPHQQRANFAVFCCEHDVTQVALYLPTTSLWLSTPTTALSPRLFSLKPVSDGGESHQSLFRTTRVEGWVLRGEPLFSPWLQMCFSV